MVLLIEEAGSVICWDFDVMKNDVSFSVLRTKVPITHRPEPQSPTGETLFCSDLTVLVMGNTQQKPDENQSNLT